MIRIAEAEVVTLAEALRDAKYDTELRGEDHYIVKIIKKAQLLTPIIEVIDLG